MQVSPAWRQRIVRALNDATTPLVVVHASSGAGKTTAATLWAATVRSASTPVLWVTLTADSTTAESVWAATTEAAHAAELSAELVATLRGATSTTLRRAALQNIARAVPNLTVILDGCEFVAEEPERLWNTLGVLARLRTSTRVIALTRWIPEVVSTALRLDPAATLVRGTDLAPRPAEIREVMESTGLPASDALLEDVRAQAHGNWRLIAAAALRRSPADGDDIDWGALLSAEARMTLTHLDMRHAATRLAWLPVLDAELAAACTGRTFAQVSGDLLLLENLGFCEQEATSGPRHRLVWSAALQSTPYWQDCAHQVDLPPETINEALRRISVTATPGDELVAALRCGALPRAAELYASLLLTAPELVPTAASEALRRLPLDTLLQMPLLAAARGLELLDDPATRNAAAAYLRPLAEQDVPPAPAGSSPTVPDSTPDLTLSTLTLRARALHHLHEPTSAATTAERAALLLQDPAFALGCTPELLAAATRHLSVALYEGGHPEQAQEVAAFGFTVAPEDQRYACAVHAHLWSALQGDMPAATAMSAHVDAHRPGARTADLRPGSPSAQFDAVARCLTHFERLELEQVDAVLASPEAHANDIWDTGDALLQWMRLARSLTNRTCTITAGIITSVLEAQPAAARRSLEATTMVLSLVWFASGEVARARTLLARTTPGHGEPSVGHFVATLLSHGPEEALADLTRLRSLPGHSLRTRAVLATLGVGTALRVGDLDRAHQQLAEITALHVQYGLRSQLVMIDSTDLAAILEYARTIDSASVAALIDGLDALVPDEVHSSLRPVLLTEREEAVLVELIHQPSRKQIASVLHVSENTVKTQLRSLYRKLEVDDRTAALARAAALGLIPPV